MESEILAQAIRGEIIESIHRGHLIIIDGAGATIAQLGNPETITFWRSSAKPFQTLPFLLSGAAEHFGFSEKEIALACGSHSGESFHVETARKMLERANFTEADLRCGEHLPFDEETTQKMIRTGEKPTPLHNNCSGKHAAMLALAKHIGADVKTYEHFENPVQQKILETISIFTDVPENEIKIGIDGCALPNFALPLSAMARAFAKLIHPPENFDDPLREACRQTVAAMMNFPEMIGGSRRLDTLLMQAAPGKIISKVGAEGVYLAGVLPSEQWKTGLAIAFKIEDGDDQRARAVVAIELLRQLGVLNESNDESLREYSPIMLKNRRGDAVGKIVPDFYLKIK
jgi:L-asparaginase II